jgi:hypothetical protein
MANHGTVIFFKVELTERYGLLGSTRLITVALPVGNPHARSPVEVPLASNTGRNPVQFMNGLPEATTEIPSSSSLLGTKFDA